MRSETPEKVDSNRRTIFRIHGGLLLLAAMYWIVSAGINALFVYHPDEPHLVGPP